MLWGIGTLFSLVAVPFYIPTSIVWKFQFLYILTNTFCLFDYNNSGGSQHYLIWFWFIFHWWLITSIVLLLVGHLYVFCSNVYSGICPFLNLVLFYYKCSYIFRCKFIITFVICKFHLPFLWITFSLSWWHHLGHKNS
jgi:hypothetical protein